MKSVLILGGAGYIGFEIATVFLWAGYKVYGLVRSNEKANFLKKNEIIPVIGDANDTESWGTIAKQVDIIIESISDMKNENTIYTVFNKIKDIKEHDNKNVHIIFTSGTWMYGHHPNDVLITEEFSYKDCPALEYIRREIEPKYISLGATVIQGTLIYGKQGSLTDDYFKTVVNQTFEYFLSSEEQTIGFIHVFDMARLFLFAAEKPHLSQGQIFIATSYIHTIVDAIKAIAKVTNIDMKPMKCLKPTNPYEECLTISQVVSSEKAKKVLGWQPTQPCLLSETKRYYDSWLQYQQQ